MKAPETKVIVEKSSDSIGVMSILGIVFVVLKLMGVIDWSWWWVTAPFWGPPVVVFGFIAVVILVVCVIWLIAFIFDR